MVAYRSTVIHRHQYGSSVYTIEHECDPAELTEEKVAEVLADLEGMDFEPEKDEWLEFVPESKVVKMPF